MLRCARSCFPRFEQRRLIALHERVHANRHHVGTAVAFCRVLSVVDPPLGGEVNRLGAVEAVIKAAMIAERECDHDLSFLLRYLVVGNSFVLQPFRIHQRRFVPEKCAAHLSGGGKSGSSEFFKLPTEAWRN